MASASERDKGTYLILTLSVRSVDVHLPEQLAERLPLLRVERSTFVLVEGLEETLKILLVLGVRDERYRVALAHVVAHRVWRREGKLRSEGSPQKKFRSGRHVRRGSSRVGSICEFPRALRRGLGVCEGGKNRASMHSERLGSHPCTRSSEPKLLLQSRRSDIYLGAI